MDKKEILKHIIVDDCKVLDAVKKIEELSATKTRVLFVVNQDSKIIGSVTDGDIRRGLLKGFSADDNVQNIMKKNYHFLKQGNYSTKDIRKLKDSFIDIVPLLDDEQKISDLLDLTKIRAYLPVSCVIMAGGKGIRLKPYTDNMPKPMLELDKKPIIVHNINRLMLYGINEFYISLNHMADKIINGLNKIYKNSEIKLHFIKEEIPMGTMGAISLINEFKQDNIIVLNADLLTNIDYEDFYYDFISSKNDLSVASFNIEHDIPYAVLDTESGRIKSFLEKPTYTYYSNAGIYLFKQKHVNLIPKNSYFDAIDFMQVMINKKHNVGNYRIRGYWLDIGKPENYKKAQEDIRHIRF